MKQHVPIHPSEVLREDFILPLGLSKYRLARYFQWPTEVWLNLQAHDDRQVTEAEMGAVLARIKPCALAA